VFAVLMEDIKEVVAVVVKAVTDLAAVLVEDIKRSWPWLWRLLQTW
jgi:hypothetical protein